ncbi:unnamed protein product [Urochloa humidicola]
MATGVNFQDSWSPEHTAQRRRSLSSAAARGVRRRRRVALRGRTGCRKDGGAHGAAAKALVGGRAWCAEALPGRAGCRKDGGRRGWPVRRAGPQDDRWACGEEERAQEPKRSVFFLLWDP